MYKLLMIFILVIVVKAQNIVTAHNDLNKSSANISEVRLTTSNVVTGKFGKLGTYTLDGYVFAQPLYVSSVIISSALYDIIIVATMNNTVYAFDANKPGSSALWSNHLTGSPRISYNGCCSGSTFLYSQPIGILSTPAVDVANNKLYVVNTNTTPTWVLSQLNLSTGVLVTSSVISGTASGTGDSSSGGVVSFDPVNELQRPGLLLVNGNVYICFGGVGDNRPWHGWIFAYSTSSLSQVAVFCTTPNSFGGAIWPPAGPAADSNGNIYISTGNGGTYDGITEFTNSTIKLSSTLIMLDWFTPSNNSTINAADADMASANPILIAGTNQLVIAAKDFNVYNLDITCMGQLQGSSGCAFQTFKTNGSGTITAFSGSYGGAFMSNTLWLPTTAGSIYEFTFSGSTFTTTPIDTQTNTYGSFGPAQMSVTSNIGSNAILWVVTSPTSTFTSVGAGTLRALNATTLSEIWNSGTDLGSMAKFVSPTIINGKVFIPNNDNALVVFGLLPSAVLKGTATLLGTIN